MYQKLFLALAILTGRLPFSRCGGRESLGTYESLRSKASVGPSDLAKGKVSWSKAAKGSFWHRRLGWK